MGYGKLSRKAQLKMVETIAVMFVFFILLVLGIVFYSRMQTVTIKQESAERFTQKAIGISQIMMFLPELMCSEEGVTKESCFDYYKLRGFNAVVDLDTDNKLYYYDQFGYANISIQMIYPGGNDIVIYDNPKPQWTTLSNFPTPISIYNPKTKVKSLGVLMVKIYQ